MMKTCIVFLSILLFSSCTSSGKKPFSIITESAPEIIRAGSDPEIATKLGRVTYNFSPGSYSKETVSVIFTLNTIPSFPEAGLELQPHEAGHPFGLGNRYDPITGKDHWNYKGNVMATGTEGTVWEQDIADIIARCK